MSAVWFYLVLCSLILLTSDQGRQMIMMFVFLASPFHHVEHAELPTTVMVTNNCTIEVFQQAVRLFRWPWCGGGAYIGRLLHKQVLLVGKSN
jgi:hypothetical protein